jgi:hypothetical protein
MYIDYHIACVFIEGENRMVGRRGGGFGGCARKIRHIHTHTHNSNARENKPNSFGNIF